MKTPAPAALEPGRIRAITIDLDDTLWPIWPTIERAEKALHEWVAINAPMTAAMYSSPQALREIRDARVALEGLLAEKAVVLLTQLMPSSTYPIRRELRVLTYQAIVD